MQNYDEFVIIRSFEITVSSHNVQHLGIILSVITVDIIILLGVRVSKATVCKPENYELLLLRNDICFFA